MPSPKPPDLPTSPTPQPAPAKTAQPGKKLSRLERLKQQQEAISAQIRQELSRETQRQRKLETRRKVLVGAAILNQVKQGKLTQEWLDQVLEVELSRECDLKVFGLPKTPASSEE